MSKLSASFLDLAAFGQTDITALKNQFDQWQDYDYTAPEDVVKHAKNADVIFTNKVKITSEILAQLPKLKLILITATGFSHVDLAAAKQYGVRVYNARDYSSVSVAEHVMTLLLMLNTRVLNYSHDVNAGRWSQSSCHCLVDYPHFDLAGQTLGLIGYGDIAKHVETLARAFSMNVIVAARKGQQAKGSRTDFDSVIKQADAISIHCPLNNDTLNYISKSELEMMKPSSVIINTARGGIINEQDLVDALNQGKIAGAGLDVLNPEPPPVNHTLLNIKHPNLIITPHTAWGSEQAKERLIQALITNLNAFTANDFSQAIA